MIFWQILWLSFWTRRFHFCWKQLSNVVLNCGGNLHTENGMLCCNMTHPLLVEYFITFFPWNRMLGRALDSIYKPLMIYTVLFLSKTTFKFHAKYHILDTLLVLDMGYCETRRGIHCSLTVSYPSWNVWEWLWELQSASINPLLMVNTVLFLPA